MSNRGFRITRRTMLRGAGAALALPWLEAMTPSLARAASGETQPPVRIGVLYMPNGVHPDMWTPEGEGRDFKFSPTLEPLNDLKENCDIHPMYDTLIYSSSPPIEFSQGTMRAARAGRPASINNSQS